MKTITLNVKNIIGDEYGIASRDGEKVYIRIKETLDAGHGVLLSFTNITLLTTAFLNSAIGRLYGEYTEEQILSHLHIENITASGEIALKRVVDTAKLYYKDPQKLQKSIDAIMEN